MVVYFSGDMVVVGGAVRISLFSFFGYLGGLGAI